MNSNFLCRLTREPPKAVRGSFCTKNLARCGARPAGLARRRRGLVLGVFGFCGSVCRAEGPLLIAERKAAQGIRPRLSLDYSVARKVSAIFIFFAFWGSQLFLKLIFSKIAFSKFKHWFFKRTKSNIWSCKK